MGSLQHAQAVDPPPEGVAGIGLERRAPFLPGGSALASNAQQGSSQVVIHGLPVAAQILALRIQGITGPTGSAQCPLERLRIHPVRKEPLQVHRLLDDRPPREELDGGVIIGEHSRVPDITGEIHFIREPGGGECPRAVEPIPARSAATAGWAILCTRRARSISRGSAEPTITASWCTGIQRLLWGKTSTKERMSIRISSSVWLCIGIH